MLNKENTKKAEQIAETMRPLFATAYKLGKIYDRTRAEQHHAERVAGSWTHPNPCEDWHYQRDGGITEQEREEVRRVYNSNKSEWHTITDQKWEEAHKAQTAHRVALINFKNYLNYMAHYLGDIIRPNWREWVERCGLSTLAEIINRKNPRKDRSAGACSVGIYDRGGELNPDKTKEGQYLRIETAIYTGWACGISGEKSRIYQTNPAEVWHCAELPPIMTASKYEKNAAKIAAKVQEIEKARDDLQQFARSCGLLGFVEIVGTIKKTK